MGDLGVDGMVIHSCAWRSVWRGMLYCSAAYLSTQNARTHTICYAAASPH